MITKKQTVYSFIYIFASHDSDMEEEKHCP